MFIITLPRKQVNVSNTVIMDEDQECVICGEKLAPTDRANVGSKGLATLIECSIERGDDLINIWQTKQESTIRSSYDVPEKLYAQVNCS